MPFVNIHGQPLELATRLEEEARRRYREARLLPVPRKATVRNGYAAVPGTGPEGMTCKDCAHKRTLGNVKRFTKCELRRADWTHGQGTDILASSPACSKFHPKEAP